jgi:hypothetical protein
MCLERWRSGHLIASSPKTLGQVPGEGERAKGAFPGRNILPAGRAGLNVYQACRVTIWIELVAKCSALVEAALGHLLHEGETETSDMQIVVRSAGDADEGIDFRGEVTRLESTDMVLAWLKSAILEARMQQDSHLIALHAAALLSQRGAVLLVGSSGSGKSTLSAALNLQGFGLVGEDVVLFDPQDGMITGIPFSFVAKKGSWNILGEYFDGIEELPVRIRADGNYVKYLKPQSVRHKVSLKELQTVIFPVYSPEADAEIVRVDRADALIDILREAQNTRRFLTGKGFSALCQALQGAEVWRLTYRDLTNGIMAIHNKLSLLADGYRGADDGLLGADTSP